MSARRRGFTLIEVLAVVLLTSIVLAVAMDFYVDLSNASQRATEHTRDVRRAAALLDRVGRDLEAAVLVEKPADVDPLAHPWLFVGESRYADGASDQIKFVTRNHEPRGSDARESDLAVVAYTVRRGEDDRLELLRWSSPRLPESLDRSFPRDEGDGALLVADGLASFGVTFLDEDGEWAGTWDSTTLRESGELPVAVEIQVAMADGEGLGSDEPASFGRRVLLPLRPLDLEVLLDPLAAAGGGAGEDGEDEEGEEGDGRDGDVAASDDPSGSDEVVPNDCDDPRSPVRSRTVLQCVNPAVLGANVEELREQYQAYLDQPFCTYRAFIPDFLVHINCR